MAWLEAIAAAYEAADEYYKKRAEKQFRDDVLAKLAEIHATTQATLAIAEGLLAWTKDAPRLIKLFDSASKLKVASEHLELLFPVLEKGGRNKEHAKREIVELHTQIVSNVLFLKSFGGFIAFPQVAYGVALILVINRQKGISPRESLPDFLKKILDFYRDCLREVPEIDAHGQKRFGWQYLHAKEILEHFIPFVDLARTKAYRDRFVIVAWSGMRWQGLDLGAVAGMAGNWEDGFSGMSSFDGCAVHPSDKRELSDFVPNPSMRTLRPISLAPLGSVDEGTARVHGDHVAGELGGMVRDRNWAVRNEAPLAEACATLREMISKLEAILGPKASEIIPEIPIDQRERIILP